MKIDKAVKDLGGSNNLYDYAIGRWGNSIKAPGREIIITASDEEAKIIIEKNIYQGLNWQSTYSCTENNDKLICSILLEPGDWGWSTGECSFSNSTTLNCELEWGGKIVNYTFRKLSLDY
jgi:hypothetical protein